MEDKNSIPAETLLEMYARMVLMRKFEEKVGDLVRSKEIITPCHLYIGQEAVAAGVCANLRKDDYIFSTHRSHGHYISKGGNIKSLMAELYGRATGCSKGKGGSMHISSPHCGMMGSSAIVAGAIPIAVGAALAFSIQEKDNVSVVFFGDGAANEGVFYESLNFAALKKLPVIFVCENNYYCTHMHVSQMLSDTNVYRKAQCFNMPGFKIDGNNVIEVFRNVNEIVENARNGKGPALIECITYRWRGHVGPNDDLDKGLRSRAELDFWIDKCPIKFLEQFLVERNILSAYGIDQIYSDAEQDVKDALAFAKASPPPKATDIYKDI